MAEATSSIRRGWGKLSQGLLALQVVLVVLGLPLPARAQAAPARGGRTLSARLENGLEVVLSEAREQPTFSLALRYHVGESSDPKELAELAHLVEHLSFVFSKHVPGTEDQLLEEAGVDSNAYTGIDATTYVSRGNVGALQRVLWLERQRMAFALRTLSAQRVELERRTLDNERLSMRVDDEAGLYWDFVSAALYPPEHPYAPRPERGCMLHCTLQHAQWLMQGGYRPDNARLVIVGDFDATTTLAQVRHLFGPIRNPGVSLPAPPRVPARAGFRHIAIAAPVERPSLQLLWLLPDALRPRRSELRVLDALLGTILNRDLAQLDGLATGVSARVTELDLGWQWSIDVGLLPGVDTKLVEQRILARLAGLRRHLPSIEGARYNALTALLESWELPDARSTLLLREGGFGLTRDKAVAALQGVTQDGVARLLRDLPEYPSLSVSLRRAVDAPKRGELYREAE